MDKVVSIDAAREKRRSTDDRLREVLQDIDYLSVGLTPPRIERKLQMERRLKRQRVKAAVWRFMSKFTGAMGGS